MFEQVSKEQRQIDREERAVVAKIDQGRKKNKLNSPVKEQVIKAATLFQSNDEETAVLDLMKEAKKSENMRAIADRASKATLEDI